LFCPFPAGRSSNSAKPKTPTNRGAKVKAKIRPGATSDRPVNVL
jgi:hypothetical protein